MKKLFVKKPPKDFVRPTPNWDEEWCSRNTSLKVRKAALRDIERAGYKVSHHWVGSWGMFLVSVQYEPGLRAPCWLSLKVRRYRHRNMWYKLPDPDIDFTDKSIEDYFASRLPEGRYVLDFNPGSPIYDKWPRIIPVTKMSLTKRFMWIYCFATPKELIDRALREIKKLGWDKWKLFVCRQPQGFGGFFYKGDYI